MCCLLRVVRSLLSVVCYLLNVGVWWLMCGDCCKAFVVCWSLLVVGCSLFVCLLSDVRCLLIVV